jgi:hypothetical protein
VVREFEIPAEEGPVYRPAIRIKKFRPGEFSFKSLGSLDRDAFNSLGAWNITDEKNGHGVAYRVGIKENFEDPEGNLGELLVVFGMPLMGHMPEEDEERIKAKYEELKEYMRKRIIEEACIVGYVTGAVLPAPDYMIKELKEELSR